VASSPPDDALWRAARDALLDHAERRDAGRSLALLLAELTRQLGVSCRVRDADTAPSPGAGLSLPVQRLGQVLGHLELGGAVAAARLDPVLPALGALLALREEHAGSAGPPRYSGPEAGLIRSALAGAGTFVWEWWIESDWLTDIDQGLRMLGYPVTGGGHTQDHWSTLIHPDDRADNHEAYLRHERGEVEVYEHAYRIRAADGRWRWMLERGRIVDRAPDGRPLRMVGTQTDITERRELERAREEAAEAQAASRAKTEFLARMSHELRTPLNAVLGFAQLMEIDQAEPPQPGQQRRLKLVREAGEHLLHMINDMLDLTRIESGGMALLDEAVPLRELATRMLELVRGLADKAQLQLVLLPGAEVTVRADRTRTR
jgi:PAS domain-containing protein